MTPKQEAIAAEIIRLFWYNPGHSYNWYTVDKDKLKLLDITLQEFNEQKPLIKDMLIEQGFIKKALGVGDWHTLTKKGREFVSFETERQTQAKEKRKADWKEWPQRHWLLLMILTFILTSILAPLGVEVWKTKLKQSTTQSDTLSLPVADTSSFHH